MLPQPKCDRRFLDGAVGLIGSVNAEDWELGSSGESKSANGSTCFFSGDGKNLVFTSEVYPECSADDAGDLNGIGVVVNDNYLYAGYSSSNTIGT